MIDNVASPNAAVANLLNTASPSPTPGTSQGAATPLAPADGSSAESFATALSRLKQAATTKPSPRSAGTEDAAENLLKLKDALLALNAEKTANPVTEAALSAHEAGENPADAVLAAIAARLAGKDKQEDADTLSQQPVAGEAVTAPVTPLAINAIPATPAAPVAQPADTEQQATTSTGLPTEAPTAGERAAILAAASDKNEVAPANTDRPQENSFADALKGAAPVALQPAHAHANNAANVTPVVREVGTSMTSPQWSNDVGNQVSWMVSQRESRADLVLNPPQLGRIEVSISLNGDQASASFVSPNAEVRDALQGSLPRLREILADAGVFLGQADIGAESFQQSNSGAEKGTKSGGDSISSSGGSLLGSAGLLASQGVAGVKRGHGLIDLFA